MYYNLYEIRVKDYWNSIDTVTIYKTAESFTKLAEKLKDIDKAFQLEIKSVKKIEEFDHSNEKNLYKIKIKAESELYKDFEVFTTAEDYVEAAKWVKEVWEDEGITVEYIQELSNFEPCD